MNTLVTILLVCAALIVVIAGLHLFVTGLLVRNQAVRPPLGLYLPGIPVGSHAWNAGHQAVWVLLFMGGVLGTAQGIAPLSPSSPPDNDFHSPPIATSTDAGAGEHITLPGPVLVNQQMTR